MNGVLLTLVLVSLHAAPPPSAPVDEKAEPPLVFFFEGEGGKKTPVELDKAFAPADLGKSATLRLEPHRRFAYAGLEFKYPREYGFEADADAQFSTWTLSGNDAKLIVQRIKNQKKVDVAHKSVVAETQKAYGGKAKESAVSIELAGKKLDGTRIEVDLAGSQIVQDWFPFKSGNDVVELIIQDSPKKAGEPSPERVRTEALLKETLKLPPAK